MDSDNNSGAAIPRHIGIILDGNGRWAKKRMLPRSQGHAQGAATAQKIVRACRDRGIEAVTLYVFSTENWKRPADEVDGIMNLLRRYLDDAESYRSENIRVRVIGDRSRLAPDICDKIAKLEHESENCDGMQLNFALNYGGREEITRAARSLAALVEAGKLHAEDITEQSLAASLDTAGQPDVDLMIRPSGEERLSNFLLWQCAYAEFVFQDVLWPDYTERDLDEALKIYSGRSRRFGGI